MNPSELPDEALFEAALSCRLPAERTAYLDRVCAGQPELRKRLEVLLHAHDQADGFLEQPVADGGGVGNASPLRASDEAPGTVIGRYKLLQKLGEGGMGDVYMAEQTEPVRRKVAFKIIKLGMDTKAVVARFEAERQALALMDHSNIAKVLDAGATENGRPYFVMELVHGVPITEYCDKNKLPTGERLKLFILVCHAIQHAHQKGIIHRDIKPSNVMVTLHDGIPVPKVIDFGVAKATNQRLTEKTLFTNYAQMIGTPAYMSPEQAEMSGLDIDTRTDVYSLGVLLYELLTGATPFDAKELLSKGYAEMQRIIGQQEPLKPSTRMSTLQQEQRTVISKNRGVDASDLGRALRGDLDWIVMKCLEKDRTRRYEAASALALDIQRHLSTEPVQACPPSRWYEFQKTVRRHKFGFAAATAIVLVLGAGGVVSTWQAVRAIKAEENVRDTLVEVSKERDRAITAETTAANERDRAMTAEGEAREQRSLALQNLYGAHIRLASQDWEGGQLQSMIETLKEDIPQTGQPDLRGWEWYYLWSLCHNPEWELGRYDGPVSSLSLHPNGQWLALSSGSEIKVLDIGSGRQLAQLTNHTQSVRSVAWSPDRTRLAAGGLDGKVILWDTERFGLLHEFDCGRDVMQVEWSPDGTQIAVGQSGPEGVGREIGVVTIWDATSGEVLHRWALDERTGIIRTLGWQPQGKMLAMGGNVGGMIQVWDPVGGSHLKTFQAHGHALTSVVWSPDGKRLATASADQRIRIWAADTWELLLDIEPAHNGNPTCLLWSKDGHTLVSGGADGFLKIWDSQNGDLLHVLRAHAAGVNSMCWSGDGTHVISGGGDGAIRRWRPDEDQSARVLSGGGGCAWSPDERNFAIGSAGEVLVLDTSTWQTKYRIACPANYWGPYVGASAWSPDGRKLALNFGNSVAQVWDVATRKEIWSWEADSGRIIEPVRCLAWSPDSRLLAVGSYSDALVRIWDPETGELVHTFKAHSSDGTGLRGVVWHPDGRRIASKTAGGRLLIWDAISGAVLREFQCPGWGAGMQNVVSWNPKGTLLAAGCGGGSIRIWDDQTGELVRELKRHEGNVRSVCWSPDGPRLVSAAEDRTIRIWDTQNWRELMILPDNRIWLPELSWSPSGRMIALLSYQTRIYDARIGYELAPPVK